MSYYAVLGVSPSVSQAELNRAFRRLLQTRHPDKHPGNDQIYQEFLRITEAYEALGTPAKRRQYDLGNNAPAVDHTNFSHFQPLHGTPLDQAFGTAFWGEAIDDGEDLFLRRKRAEPPEMDPVRERNHQETPISHPGEPINRPENSISYQEDPIPAAFLEDDLWLRRQQAPPVPTPSPPKDPGFVPTLVWPSRTQGLGDDDLWLRRQRAEPDGAATVNKPVTGK